MPAPSTKAAQSGPNQQQKIWFGSMVGSRRSIIGGAILAAGCFVVFWVLLLALALWLMSG
jgi:hypothetical protein